VLVALFVGDFSLSSYLFIGKDGEP